MGAIGRCCCDPCDTCTEASGFENWIITTPINGLSLSGTLGTVNANCKKFGYGCDREDETVYDDYEERPEFNPDLNFSLLMWTETGCQCGETTFTGEAYQSRTAQRWRFWLSKYAEATVEIIFPTPTTMKVIAYITMAAGGTVTTSTMTQRRLFTADGDIDPPCVPFNITYGTPSDPGPIAAPEPLPPCSPILFDIQDIQQDCPFPPPYGSVADPCEYEEFYEKDFNVLVPSGYTCVSQARKARIMTLRTQACCQDFCRQSVAASTRVYESAVINCDEIPSTITLNILGLQGTVRVSWRECGIGFPPAFFPADLFYTPPATIQIQLS